MLGGQMALSNLGIKAASTQDKVLKLNDGDGLYLFVHKNGSKFWKFRYKFQKKSFQISLGGYPAISLSDARIKCIEFRKLLSLRPPVNPRVSLDEKTDESIITKSNTFCKWGNLWFSHWSSSVSDRHANYTQRRLDLDIFPILGKIPVAEITKEDIKKAIQKCLDRKANDMAKRIFEIIRMILQYTVEHDDKSLCRHNVANDIKLSSTVPRVKRQNFPRLPISEWPMLMKKIEAYQGRSETRLALKLFPYLLLRPSELTEGEWTEIEWENKLWRIPARRMKGNTEHLVPLSSQVIYLLRILHEVSGHSFYMFPSRSGPHGKDRMFNSKGKKLAMCNNTILHALERMGLKGKMTGHGFRGMARTQLAEMGYERDWLELQLSHLVGDETERAYNYAQYLPQRRQMLQEWADFLETIK